jgi:hypothetical protein
VHLDRAVLRPGLRLRHHSAVEPARARPDPRRRGEGRTAGARGLVGVGLHGVGHELVRRGAAGGARDPPRRDVRRHGRRDLDPRRLRRPGEAASGRLRGHPGHPQLFRRLCDPPRGPPTSPGPADLRLVARRDAVVDRRGAGRRLGARGPLVDRARPRLRRSAGRPCAAGPRSLAPEGLEHRAVALRRAARAVPHHRSWRVDRGGGRNRLAPVPDAAAAHRGPGGDAHDRGVVVVVLRHACRTDARAPARSGRRARAPRPGSQLPVRPARRRDHRGGGRQRAGHRGIRAVAWTARRWSPSPPGPSCTCSAAWS